MIKLNNINKYFNKHKKNEIHVINNTSLEFKNTGLVALLGESGSGKTTLLNTIGGLDKVNSGEIYINDQKITRFCTNKIDEIRNLNIGYIFQNYELIDNMTVYDNVALVLKMLGIKDKSEIKKRVDYVLNIIGIYRYRNRLASMLSGGERQRVGIARAIVKNPNIIIADEPTGNLDSKNTLEVMNIIKSISTNRLVILVTHEKELAYFYADRIINLEDGKIISDKRNNNIKDLDYQTDNKIYLKDIKNNIKLKKDNLSINYYNDNNEKTNLEIVVRNNSIYIKSTNNNQIKIVDDNSNIEFINDNYKKISQKEVNKYKFDFNDIIDNNIKYKYSSIFNIFTLISNGFKKVLAYSKLKKVLLIGFFVSAMFVLYSISNIFGILNIKDENFVVKNKKYLDVSINKNSIDNFLEYEKNEDINYILPGDSIVGFNHKYQEYYQTSKINDVLTGSLSSNKLLNDKDIIYGKMPTDTYDVIVDIMCFKNMFNRNITKQAGITKYQDMLNEILLINNMNDFKIVGIVDKKSPSIYTDESLFVNILSNKNIEETYNMNYYEDYNKENTNNILDYELLKDKIELKEGHIPTNDYEVIVNISNKEEMKLNKEIEVKINNKKLKVVGYYYDKYQNQYLLVNNNTIKYNLIINNSNLTINSNNKDKTLNYFRTKNIYINDSYENSKNKYMEEIKDSIKSSVIVASIILAISLVEIFLMIRSSFLSRIKEVGIYRAIGVKKIDIYKMFLGEILSITTIAGMSGYIIMAYVLNKIVNLPYIGSKYLLNGTVLLLSLIVIYLFNILIGLLPVFNTLRKTPAQILSRTDVD